MLNSCVIRCRYNLWTKQSEDKVTTNKYQGVTIKGKVTKQQVKQLKKEHSGKDEGNIIIWEVEEAE